MNIYLKYKSILLLGFGGFFLPSDAAVWGGIFEFTHQKGETFFTLKPAVKWNEYLFFFCTFCIIHLFLDGGCLLFKKFISMFCKVFLCGSFFSLLFKLKVFCLCILL